jgi:SAM-dependent methyltransferase
MIFDLAPDDYYGELAAHPDPARAVGWEHSTAQAERFDVVTRFVRDGDALLDLGAGLGDLGRHLARRGWTGDYRGIERDERLLARGRARSPPVALTHGDFTLDDCGEADVVAAIGVLVDGRWHRSDAIRFARLRRLLEIARRAARRCAIVIALDQDRLEAHPTLSLEPALGGVRRSEIPWLAPDAEVQPLGELELVLILRRP